MELDGLENRLLEYKLAVDGFREGKSGSCVYTWWLIFLILSQGSEESCP